MKSKPLRPSRWGGLLLLLLLLGLTICLYGGTNSALLEGRKAPTTLAELVELKKKAPELFQEYMKIYARQAAEMKTNQPQAYETYLQEREKRLNDLTQDNPELLRNAVQDYLADQKLSAPSNYRQFLDSVAPDLPLTNTFQSWIFSNTEQPRPPISDQPFQIPQSVLPPMPPAAALPPMELPRMEKPKGPEEMPQPYAQPNPPQIGTKRPPMQPRQPYTQGRRQGVGKPPGQPQGGQQPPPPPPPGGQRP